MGAGRLELTEEAGGLGYRLRIDPRSSMAELTAAVESVCDGTEDRQSATVVVLHLLGSKPGETSDWPGLTTIQQVNRWERAIRRLERTAAVTIALADQVCGGPALDLLLAADYRIASRAFALSLPVNDGQFWPGMVCYRLATQLGVARARQLVLWGNTLTADQAANMSLVDEIVADPEDAAGAAIIMLGRIAGTDLAVRRQLLAEALSVSYEEALGAHLAACDRELRRLDGRSGKTDQT